MATKSRRAGGVPVGPSSHAAGAPTSRTYSTLISPPIIYYHLLLLLLLLFILLTSSTITPAIPLAIPQRFAGVVAGLGRLVVDACGSNEPVA